MKQNVFDCPLALDVFELGDFRDNLAYNTSYSLPPTSKLMYEYLRLLRGLSRAESVPIVDQYDFEKVLSILTQDAWVHGLCPECFLPSIPLGPG